MTRYTIVWQQDAVDDLAQIWLEASDRVDVTDAANRIDVELASGASSKGEDVGDGLRILVVAPLEVAFIVVPDDRIVRVVFVLRHP